MITSLFLTDYITLEALPPHLLALFTLSFYVLHKNIAVGHCHSCRRGYKLMCVNYWTLVQLIQDLYVHWS